VKEMQVLHPNIVPDHIFLASGTGSTQAGIIAGCQEVGWFHTQVHGISVARDKNRGVEAILEALVFVYTEPAPITPNINFYDEYRFGGYGKYDQQLLNFINDAAEKSGIILDPTYTGKGFYGMMDVVTQKKLSGNILFWHTGGLLNLMA
ncbi:MAG TPA: pyridoxal-phosphate dependent enzyme, partial [Bacteroidales bacterium]|nr:pyridoxal-phosphate dependent enzyme [Bacteroidales bacterium]